MGSELLIKNLYAISNFKEENISQLLRIDTTPLDFSKTKKGDNLFLRYKNFSLHSFYDPIIEASHYTESHSKYSDTLFIFGLGLLFHIESFLKKFNYNKIVVYEPDCNFLVNLLSYRDFSVILSKIEIITTVNQDSFNRYFDENKIDIFLLPSYLKIYNNYQDDINYFLKKNRPNNNFLKILLVGPLYGGSLSVFQYVALALQNLHHQVIKLDFTDFYPGLQMLENLSVNPQISHDNIQKLTEMLSEIMVNSAIENDVDLVLGIAQSPFTVNSLKKLKNKKISTSFWFVEDFQTLKYWKILAPYFDNFFVIQKEFILDKLKKMGTKSHYLPMAASPFDLGLLDHLSDSDKNYYGSTISFMGAGYYNRKHSFQRLINYDFKIWGNGWEDAPPQVLSKVMNKGERIYFNDIKKIYRSSYININLHSSSIHNGVSQGDFVNPRTFEICMAKGFQLVDQRSLIGELFSEDEMCTFKDIDELISKIHYFKNHPDERQQYIEKGYNKVVREHTYSHRMSRLIDIVSENGVFQFTGFKRLNNNKSDLIELAKEMNSPYLINLIENLPDNKISISSIVKYLKSQNRELNYDDKIWFLVYEFYRFAKRKNLIKDF